MRGDCHRSKAATRRWLHRGHQVPQVAFQPSPGAKEERHVAALHRLHQPQRRVPQGRVRPPQDRPDHRLDRRVRVTLLPRRILWVHQIKMAVDGQEKTAFTTPFGCYMYTAMTFGIKNAGAMYQRCMTECLKEKIGRNVHVYIDDVVV